METLYRVQPFRKAKIEASARIPGSKSISNRVLLIAALSAGTTRFDNLLFSDDTLYMAQALRDLGVKVDADPESSACTVEGTGKPPSGSAKLFVGNAGTAMRFLTSYLSTGNGEFVLDGDERMRQRPIADLAMALSGIGCSVIPEKGCPPLRIQARGMGGGVCTIEGKNSSQYISSVLMAAPYALAPVTVRTGGEVSSKPYIDMTLGVMESFGVRVERQGYREFLVPLGKYASPGSYMVEPDASSASYFLAAGAILSGRVEVPGLGANSLQGDTGFVKILERMGCKVAVGDHSLVLESTGKLRGIDVDMNALPDMVPTLAAVALFAEGSTRVTNTANLRIKESDRITALCTELRKLGAKADELPDGLVITPAKAYRGAQIATYNDHRIAMSFALAGLKIPGVGIENPACVAKSFPDFFSRLEKFLG